ncbi:MAG TPA: Ldh family oxidoreductase [Acidithiobacillus sp.]|jgi:ureidoglycolate dehydrogenase (NAD+)|nr:Ldh family oxidoreductase [Acidithiobacillus sp.]
MKTDVVAPSRIQAQDLKNYCVAAMLKAGLSPEDAELTAEVLVTTDTWGTYTHGTRQLRGLLKNIRNGRLDAQAKIEIVSEGLAWAMVDGHYVMPPATSCRAMELAIRKAKVTGMGYVGVKHSSHFGAAGYYAVMAAQQGLIGLSMCNLDPVMVVPGSRGRAIGNNPLAYAVPAEPGRPVFLDIALSTVAGTRIYNAQLEGKTIPDNWMVDDEGLPTTDPSGFPTRGAQLPMAGHKGYGLAVLVEALSAVLTGAAIASQVKSWVLDTPEPTDEGHAFMALDVAAMMPPEIFQARMEGFIREIREAPKAMGAERIFLPGEMEWERREAALAQGMIMPAYVLESLRGLAVDVGLEPGRYNLIF